MFAVFWALVKNGPQIALRPLFTLKSLVSGPVDTQAEVPEHGLGTPPSLNEPSLHDLCQMF